MNKLTEGQKAPVFVIKDIFNNIIDLNNYSEKTTLLCFFRYAGCPWCNLALHHLSKVFPELNKKGLEVIAFLQSEKENILENILQRHVPKPQFTLISDPNLEIYKKYGVEEDKAKMIASLKKIPAWVDASFKKKFMQTTVDGSLFLVPAQFIIGPPDLTIKKTKYWSDYYDPMTFVEINEFLTFDVAN